MSYKFPFSVTPTGQAAQPVQKWVEHAYNEFAIDLPAHWELVPNPEENTFTYNSKTEDASIIISADFYAIPSSLEQATAEKCIHSRLSFIEQQNPGRVEVIHRSIRPHSGGVGLELSYAAEIFDDHMFMYLGYVTSRKILNFNMICKPERAKALALFNATIKSFRAKLP